MPETCPLRIAVGEERIDYELLSGAVHVHPLMCIMLEDSPWLLWLREALDLPELFEYRHRWTGNFMLAGWLPSGVMAQELWNYDHQRPWWPGGDERPTTRLAFLNQLNRSSKERAEERVRAMLEIASMEKMEAKEDLEEKKDLAKFTRLKGMVAEGDALLKGRTPFAGTNAGGDTLAMIRDALKPRPQVFDVRSK